MAPSISAPRAPQAAVPAADSLRLAEIELATGIRMRFAEQGEPAHHLILLHGYSDSWFSFSRVLPGLARDFRTYALDLRGHGGSDGPDGGYTMGEMAADVIAFMDARGIAQAAVAGHSMGSFVAQQVAAGWPDRVSGLVLIGSGTTPRHIAGIADLAQAVDSLHDPVDAGFAREFQLSTVHRPLPAEFLDEAVRVSQAMPARVWREALAGMLETAPEPRLAVRTAPTLILWGDRDALFDRAEQDALLAAMPGAALTIYPDTGHAVHWERPDECVRDLAGFLLPRKH